MVEICTVNINVSITKLDRQGRKFKRKLGVSSTLGLTSIIVSTCHGGDAR